MAKKNDGFFTLIPKKTTSNNKTKKKKKSKAPKFKKGGWKHWLYKKLKGWKSSRHVKQFHLDSARNIIIASTSDPEAMFFDRRVG
ncbi:MAG: hypothetical protein K2L93_06400, partial [Muribaculaceae bacterium]|nr:hypothetical protein [Muribaculaceae bacterium]